MRELLSHLNYLRSIIAYLYYCCCNLKIRKKINEDLDHWREIYNVKKYDTFYLLNYFLFNYKEYRNVFSYRIDNKFIRKFFNILLPGEKTLTISTANIDGGLVIFHGTSTIINAKSIGKNFVVYQNVTIGNIDGKNPIIGDNVQITVSSVVLGDISIGDNSIIGANSTVTKNVPKNCTVVGTQAFIVKENGEKIYKKL